MMALWIVAAAVLVVFLFYLARRGGLSSLSSGAPGAQDKRSEDAEDILRDRYARGEIDDEEYHHRLDELHSHGHA